MTGWSHPAFEQVAHIVTDQTGLSFPAHRRLDAEVATR
jgi:hypothetical protein